MKAVKVSYDDGTEHIISVSDLLSDDFILRCFPVGSSRNIGTDDDYVVRIASVAMVPSITEEL